MGQVVPGQLDRGRGRGMGVVPQPDAGPQDRRAQALVEVDQGRRGLDAERTEGGRHESPASVSSPRRATPSRGVARVATASAKNATTVSTLTYRCRSASSPRRTRARSAASWAASRSNRTRSACWPSRVMVPVRLLRTLCPRQDSAAPTPQARPGVSMSRRAAAAAVQCASSVPRQARSSAAASAGGRSAMPAPAGVHADLPRGQRGRQRLPADPRERDNDRCPGAGSRIAAVSRCARWERNGIPAETTPLTTRLVTGAAALASATTPGSPSAGRAARAGWSAAGSSAR